MVAPLRVPYQLTGSCSIPTDHVGNANLPMCDLNSIHVKLDNLLEKQSQILQALSNLPGIVSCDATDDIDLDGISLPVGSMEDMNKLADILKDKRTRRRLVSDCIFQLV
jgi:hypothetical protein